MFDDQVPDLAVANSISQNVAVLLGLGDGSFGEASFYGAGESSNSIAIGDLDGAAWDRGRHHPDPRAARWRRPW